MALDSPEYAARLRTPFAPPPPALSIKAVRAAVPRHLFQRSTRKCLFFVGRHVLLTALFALFAARIDDLVPVLLGLTGAEGGGRAEHALLWVMWATYWLWQSVAFMGLWTLGHECGHDALSPIPRVNAALGMALHTAVLTPYWAWRATHRSHHKGTNNLHRDETYHPQTREEVGLPEEEKATALDYREMIEETPLYTLRKMVLRQFLGFQLYLIHNRKGNPKYPPGTSHYRPGSELFRDEERHLIVVSDLLIAGMLALLGLWAWRAGWGTVWRMYFVPWLWAHNWIVTVTYLQHSDPTVPYYRVSRSLWTFLRGALATVDRPVFGWVGRFFWHGIAHDHVAHHFFVGVPFYNLPEVTEAIKPVLGEYYYCDSTPTLYALWRSFTQCKFIESTGDVVFFKNMRGEAVRKRSAVVGGEKAGELAGRYRRAGDVRGMRTYGVRVFDRREVVSKGWF
ncbi:fatty acid desaturase-domain-containing protein [Rhodofomes roseus]|uniref:Fatty acid desaturase-domain-containing protein n=1 Tax=Rhodofomes roseus TaxID=34475 RepID=A0ABQ8K4C5_9APHY|nr:fatty acid desaturase-domain-containing protein [Rhodofomes roseus]KAH9831761.1 fatty acid desaturase-domain-containing protein [Rhodofomes roseus]